MLSDALTVYIEPGPSQPHAIVLLANHTWCRLIISFETTSVFAVTVVQAEREFWACLEVVMRKTNARNEQKPLYSKVQTATQ